MEPARAHVPPRPPLRVLAAVFLLAAVTLGLQVALTRHFSFLYWHHFAFMIIGIGMLGFGAAGAWLARGGGVPDGAAAQPQASAAALAAALAALGYLWLGPALEFAPLSLLEDRTQLLQLLALYALVLVPFTALGLAQGSLIAGYRAHAHRVYGADLLGAGLGCLLALALLARFGAATSLLLFGAAAAVAAALLAPPGRAAWRAGAGAGALALVGLAASGWAESRGFLPAPSKELGRLLRSGAAGDGNPIDHVSSSATIRIDVTRPVGVRFGFGGEVAWPGGAPGPLLTARGVYQDGASPTILYDIDDLQAAWFLGRTNHGLAYSIREKPKVCVIGAGGGPDLWVALHHGAREITAVELAPNMLALGLEHYRDFVNGLFQREEVRPVLSEGRHFLARTGEKFDLIQMSGVDTYAALASGAYAMSESYLYTVEAAQAMLRALAPDGLVSESRWFLDPPRETLRLANVFAEALRREGAENPADHLYVVRGDAWGTTLVSRRPFTPAELEALRAWAADPHWRVAFDPDGSGDPRFTAALMGTAAERRAFLDSYFYDVSPTTDDAPFFFQFYRWRHLLGGGDEPNLGGYAITRIPVGFAVLGVSLLQMAGLAALCIAGPLWSRRSQLREAPGHWRVLGFFALLGFGFMGIEITSLQAFTVFLGAPVYSMAVTLASLLVTTGLGALWAGRSEGEGQRLVRNAVIAIGLWVVASVALLHPLLAAAIGLPLPLRGAIVALWLLPVGLALGVPLPTAIRELREQVPALVPWAWGANACASVLASVGVVLVSMQVGFRATLGLTALVYACAYLAWRPASRGSGSKDVKK